MELTNQRQRLTIISAVYNVEKYLPDFLNSLADQTTGLADVELIFVIDGSPDSSESIIRDWSRQNAQHAKVIVQENGGAGAARNTGLNNVTTDLVTFTDPDDVLHPKYLETVLEYLASENGANVDMVVTNQLVLNDETGEVTNSHPLRVRFSKRAQAVELNRHPNYIHLQAASAFYRTKVILDRNIRFDVRVRPNFEDAHFTAKYLLEMRNPRVAFLKEAEYWYRKRTNRSSLIQTSWQKPEKYIDLPKYGYLALLAETKEEHGSIPEWIQNLVLYDIFWYMREDDRMHSATADIPKAWADAFHEYLGQILDHIDEYVIADYRVINTHWHHRQELLQKYKQRPVQYTEVSVNELDEDQQCVRLRYVYSEQMPREEFRARGYVVKPIHETTQLFTFLGREMMYMRTVWLPATGTLSLTLDGHRVPLRAGGFVDSPYRLPASRIWRVLADKPVPVVGRSSASGHRMVSPHGARAKLKLAKKQLSGFKESAQLRVEETRINRTVRSVVNIVEQQMKSRIAGAGDPKLPGAAVGARFIENLPENFDDYTNEQIEVARRVAQHKRLRPYLQDAWLLMDRDTEAHDNAEHLFRHLMEHNPKINAWFVLSEDSNDWARLKDEKFRLVSYRSLAHLLLLLNSRNLVSSQVDHYVVHPFQPRRFGKFPWKFTFLQHGVSTNEISRWLNRKPIDLLITSSKLEYDEFIRDGSTYRFSTKDTAFTGMPRFDQLFSRSIDSNDRRDILLIMPTWRRWLLGEELAGNERQKLPDFHESQYSRYWGDFLNSVELQEYAKEHDLQVAFMPHPNMRPYLEDFPKPNYVKIFSYHDTDVQDLLVRAAVIVSDYSSVTFDGAYIGVPIAYFQFDRDEFFAGGHVARAGTWSYQENGLGPIAEDVNELTQNLRHIAQAGFNPSKKYEERVRKTFPITDDKSSERVTTAILALHKPLTYDQAYHRVIESR